MQYPKNYKPKEIVSQTGFLCQTARTKTPVFNRILFFFLFFTSSTTSSSSSTTTFSKIMWSPFERWRILYNTVKNWNYLSWEKCFLHLKFFFWFHFYFQIFQSKYKTIILNQDRSTPDIHDPWHLPSYLYQLTSAIYIYIHILYVYIYIHVEMCICNFLFLFVYFFSMVFCWSPKK